MQRFSIMFGALAGLVVAGGAAARPVAPVAIPQPPMAAPHARLLPLQGGQNFRDLGGYRTADGRTVRWGLLYRSGSMHFLTAADHAVLAERGIQTVCDFRDSRERAAEPATWTGSGPKVLADDYAMDAAAMGLNAPGRALTAESAKAMMAGTYPRLLTQFNGQYRRMFGELLAGRAPLAFNCTAGKDRTGVAAALVLTALGVPRATVIEDYALTNRYFDPTKVVRSKGQASMDWSKLPPGVRTAFMAADPAYIEAAFRVIDAHPGGAAGYLRDELGLGPAQRATLRRLYTE